MRRSRSIETGAAVAGMLFANSAERIHPRMTSDGADQVSGLGLCAGYLLQSILFMRTLIHRNGAFLRRSISIVIGVVSSGILTHGMVRSAMNLADRLPISTYLGFFQHVVFATERVWSRAHGWRSMAGDIRAFGQFYAQMVHLLCPLIGFVVFWIVSRRHFGMNVWKAMTIVGILALTPLAGVTYEPLFTLGISREWAEVARTVTIVLLMIRSVGAIKISKPQTPSTEPLATA